VGILPRPGRAYLSLRQRANGAASHSTASGTRARSVAGAALVLSAALALSACDSGAIGGSNPQSNGQSYVSGSAGTTVYKDGAGPAVPHITGTMLTGQKFTLGQDRGSVVVLNFWGSWCTPCRSEAPVLSSLAHRFTGRGVRFLGVDIRDSPANAAAFQSTFKIGYPSLNDPGDVIALDFQNTVPPAGIPTTLVIGRNNRIAARIIGEVSYPGLSGLISRAMARPA
jgi:thiol-disulfide isomerase/thioredoxin